MFGFLKKKLKNALNNFTKKVEEEAEVVEEIEQGPIEKPQAKKADKEIKEPKLIKKEKKIKEEKKPGKKAEEKEVIEEKPKEEKKAKEKEPAPPKPKKEGFFTKIFKTKEKQETEEKQIEPPKPKEEPKTFLERLTKSVTNVTLSEDKFNNLFWDLEVSLLENNVAVEVIEKIKNDLKEDLVNKKIPRKSLDIKVISSLKKSIEDLFDVKQINLIKEISKKKPYIIAVIGINGSGKTTTLAKIAHLFQQNKLEPVVAACDTFRAAAIQQLEEHTKKLGVKLIKHDYGSDPAAVAFDAVKHAQSKNKDVVLIDTAGRLHSDKNLMQELEKIIRVAKPDLKIFVGESIAGNDVVEQVKYFNDKVGIDAIILAKADIDEKGGAAISVSYITGKPILYLGTGQSYDDLTEFSKDKLIEQIGLS